MGKYCRECGCEILTEEDLGLEGIELETYAIMPGIIAVIKHLFHVCRACLEEEERKWEERLKTSMGLYECGFQGWVEEEFGGING